MKIINPNEGLLTNFEVQKILKEKKADQRESTSSQPSEKKVFEYISARSRFTENADITRMKTEFLSDYGLTVGEALQLINLQPESDVEVPLIVEDCDERLTQDQIENIVTSLNSP